jgi:hypothetical protein
VLLEPQNQINSVARAHKVTGNGTTESLLAKAVKEEARASHRRLKTAARCRGGTG